MPRPYAAQLRRFRATRPPFFAALVLAAIGAAPLAAQPISPVLDYVPLDFGASSTFLTGIRGDNIVGNSVIPGGETGGLYYNAATGVWAPFPTATPNGANFPGAVGSSPYGPSFGSPGGVLRVVGSYKTAASPVDRAYLYDGAAAPGAELLTLVYPDPGTEFTIAHSTFGNTVVGNYDTGPLTGNAFIYDIPSGTYTTNNRPGAISTTAYGVWGDKIAGGYGRFGPDREPGFEHGYIYDMRSGRWTTHDHPDAVFTHFEGITGAGRGGEYNLVADWIGADGLQAAVLHIDADGNETWIPIAYPGADTTSANSIHQDRVIGVYTDATGTHGFEVRIPGIYNPIRNTETLVSDADGVTVLEGGPGDDVVNDGAITTTGNFNNAIRGDRYGVIYNSGDITVSGRTSGAVALRGDFPTLLNSGTLTAAPAGDAVRADANAYGSLVVNTGVIDGRVDVRSGPDARFENSGLIGLSGAGAGVSSVMSGVFAQTAAGTLAPRIQGANADTLTVLGTARLAGTFAPSFQAGDLERSYTLLTATAERTGAFDTLAPVGLADFVDASVDYSTRGVELVLTADIAATPGLSRNQAAVGRALDAAFNDGGGIPDGLNAALFGLAEDQLGGALDAQSGEIYASEQAVLVDDALLAREAVLGRVRQAIGGGAGFGGPRLSFDAASGPQAGRGVTLWGQALGARGRFDGDAAASQAKSTLGGVFGGADMAVGANAVVGLAFGYAQSDVRVDALRSSADAETLLVAAYGGTGFGPWSLRAGASYAKSSIDAERTISFPGYSAATSADYDADTTQVFGEVGYGMVAQGVALEPFLGLAWVHLDSGGFSETGGAAALTAKSASSDYGAATLGVRAAASYDMANGATVSPRLSAAWRRAFGDLSTSASLAYAEAGGAGFTVSGVSLARDTALIDLGVDVRVGPAAVLGVSYFGQLASDASNNAIRANLAWAF